MPLLCAELALVWRLSLPLLLAWVALARRLVPPLERVVPLRERFAVVRLPDERLAVLRERLEEPPWRALCPLPALLRLLLLWLLLLWLLLAVVLRLLALRLLVPL